MVRENKPPLVNVDNYFNLCLFIHSSLLKIWKLYLWRLFFSSFVIKVKDHVLSQTYNLNVVGYRLGCIKYWCGKQKRNCLYFFDFMINQSTHFYRTMIMEQPMDSLWKGLQEKMAKRFILLNPLNHWYLEKQFCKKLIGNADLIICSSIQDRLKDNSSQNNLSVKVSE